MLPRTTLAVCALGLIASPGLARAQAGGPPPAAVPAELPAAPPLVVAEPAPPPPPPVSAAPSFKIEPSPGNTLKVGLLLQPQFQALGDHALDGNAYNLFLRRTRVLLGGTVLGAFDFFVETDSPNLFIADNTAGDMMTGAAAMTAKNTPGMFIQDAFMTWKGLGNQFKVDAGYMLPPLAHNAIQSAGSLYSWDYYAFSFLSGNAFGSAGNPVGRDLGVQLRGLVLGGHLEYRVGVFQGLRTPDTATTIGSNNSFRVAGRVQFNVFDPETGFFYAGTYLGKKKILSIGVSGDTQDPFHYSYVAGDVFADLPLGPGVFTAQVNVAHWDGGSFIPAIPKETAFMSEVGFNFNTLISPILHIEYLWAPVNQAHVGGGVAFWPYGHTSNLKVFYTRNTMDNTLHASNQVNVQWQLFFF